MATFDPPDFTDKPIHIGQNATNSSGGLVAPLFVPTYANLATIQVLIQSIQTELSSLLTDINNILSDLSLVITIKDTTLATAVAQTWPNSLGLPPNYVTFNYYNYLLSQSSSAATLITNAYLSGAQGTGGNDAIDLLPIVNVLNNEVNYIDAFIATNLSGGLNDSSEHRAAELFQDVLTSINTQVQNAQRIFTNQSSLLTQEEKRQLSRGDAQNAQALFQVNLNKLNIQLNQDIQILHTNFASNASTFYSEFLEPALKFRQNVTSQMLPMYNGMLGAAINTSVNATNLDLQNALVDQQNRINFLATQVDQIMRDIINRDVYRNYIIQLANQGVPIPSGISGQMIQATDSPAALTFFDDAAAGILPPATPSFNADHQALNDRLDPLAHPQYITLDQYNNNLPSWFQPFGYTSLIGPGQIATPGSLTQTGDFRIDGSLNVNASTSGINLGSGYGVSIVVGNSDVILQTQGSTGNLFLNGFTADGAVVINAQGTAGLTLFSQGGMTIEDDSNNYMTFTKFGSGFMSFNATGDTGIAMGTDAGQFDITTHGGINIYDISNSGIIIGQQSNSGQILIDSANTISISASNSVNISGNNSSIAAFGVGTTTIAGSSNKLAFFQGIGTTKPTITGSKGGNAALASLMAQLANFGLITDSTT